MATTTPSVAIDELEQKPTESQSRLVVRRFFRHRLAVINLVVLFLVFATSTLAPVLTAFEPDDIVVGSDFLLPGTYNEEAGAYHILGTDELGRDYLTRVLYAGRVSLTVAVAATLLSTLIGLVLGLLAGYFGGWVDVLLTRFVEFVSTFPPLIILLILVALLVENAEQINLPGFLVSSIITITSVPEREAPTIALVILTLGLLYWPGTARLMRGMVLSVREQPYIESSRALGGSNLRIIARHVFPNAYPPLIVDFTLGLNTMLVLESSLSYLGFGIQGTPTWGNMLAFAQSHMFQHPWVPLVPGLPILLASLAINYVGDGLRDALDPRQKL
jgi:peptide/nickel transport system permease protein